jgi:hypothetical protein
MSGEFWVVWPLLLLSGWTLVIAVLTAMYQQRRPQRQRRQKLRREAFHDQQRERYCIHDTWGKVYPTCRCVGCAKEREYVRTRQMWKGGIINSPRGNVFNPPQQKHRELTERVHYLNNTPWEIRMQPALDEVEKRYNPPPPPVFGECTDCNMETMYDQRQPFTRLCTPCVELAEAKHHNRITWGADV